MLYKVRPQGPPQFLPHKINFISTKQFFKKMSPTSKQMTLSFYIRTISTIFFICSQSPLLEATGTEVLGRGFRPVEDLPHTMGWRTEIRNLLSSGPGFKECFTYPEINSFTKGNKAMVSLESFGYCLTLIHSHSSEPAPLSTRLSLSPAVRPGGTNTPLSASPELRNIRLPPFHTSKPASVESHDLPPSSHHHHHPGEMSSPLTLLWHPHDLQVLSSQPLSEVDTAIKHFIMRSLGHREVKSPAWHLTISQWWNWNSNSGLTQEANNEPLLLKDISWNTSLWLTFL